MCGVLSGACLFPEGVDGCAWALGDMIMDVSPDLRGHLLPLSPRPGNAARGVACLLFGLVCFGLGCGPQTSAPTGKGPEVGAGGSEGAPAAGASLSVPQDALARRTDAVVLPGTVEVPGYTGGLIQVDVYPAESDMTGQGPLTTLRMSAPGPFKLLLPPEVPRIAIRAQLDLKQDGPDWRDPFVLYSGNPIGLDQLPSELTLLIDLTHTLRPPPGQGQGEGSERPPWEATGQKPGDTQSAPAAGAPPAAAGAPPAAAATEPSLPAKPSAAAP